jgi:hypothetical protein
VRKAQGAREALPAPAIPFARKVYGDVKARYEGKGPLDIDSAITSARKTAAAMCRDRFFPVESGWKGAAAKGGERRTKIRAQNRRCYAIRRLAVNNGNAFAVHGKEGVDGSSPSEGSAKAPQIGAFCLTGTCTFSSVRWVWSPSWSPQVHDARSKLAK